jgi:energy-coupling factor transport system ATP-binding protein
MRVDGSVLLSPRDFQSKYPKAGPIGFDADTARLNGQNDETRRADPVLRLCGVSFSYPGSRRNVLDRLSMECITGEMLCIIGGNGGGKSSLLKLIAGINKPTDGKIKTRIKKFGYMPQHVRDYFLYESVGEEMTDANSDYTRHVLERLGISDIMDRHPFDLSGGEQQKAVLAAILTRKPELIVLDEPTKGTHDLEFAARHAHRCAMLFDGEIIYSREPRGFFPGSRYYTTAVHKALRHIDGRFVLPEDVMTSGNG